MRSINLFEAKDYFNRAGKLLDAVKKFKKEPVQNEKMKDFILIGLFSTMNEHLVTANRLLHDMKDENNFAFIPQNLRRSLERAIAGIERQIYENSKLMGRVSQRDFTDERELLKQQEIDDLSTVLFGKLTRIIECIDTITKN